MRLTGPKRYKKQSHYVGKNKNTLDMNAGFCSTHRVLSGKLTVRTEFAETLQQFWHGRFDKGAC